MGAVQVIEFLAGLATGAAASTWALLLLRLSALERDEHEHRRREGFRAQ